MHLLAIFIAESLHALEPLPLMDVINVNPIDISVAKPPKSLVVDAEAGLLMASAVKAQVVHRTQTRVLETRATITSANGVNHEHTFCLHPDVPSFIALDARPGKLLATDTEDLGHRMWHCLWSPPTIGVVNGKKLVFFGGGDGICYAFEALTSTPDKLVHFKQVWSYDCVPPNYRDPLGDGKSFNYYIASARRATSGLCSKARISCP